MLSIIQAAGWPIWPLLICSIAALTVVIERLMNLRTVRVAPTRLLDEVISVTRAHLPAPDVVNKLADNSVLGTVLAAGLRAVIADPRITEMALRNAFEAAGRAAVHRLERYLNTLGTIASAAPEGGCPQSCPPCGWTTVSTSDDRANCCPHATSSSSKRAPTPRHNPRAANSRRSQGSHRKGPDCFR